MTKVATSRTRTPSSTDLFIKRAVDVAISSAGLVVALPLFVAIAVAIRAWDGPPVFFRQRRIGRNGRPFTMVKFRTMIHAPAAAGPNFTLRGDSRVTRLGALLRGSKLDELPQLFNVLRGEMSLVGPRPETPDLIAHYTPAARTMRLSIRPGVTDYASWLLRDEGALLARAPDPEAFYRERLMPLKIALCELYLDRIGLMADLRIILATVCALASSVRLRRLIDLELLNRIAAANGVCLDDVSSDAAPARVDFALRLLPLPTACRASRVAHIGAADDVLVSRSAANRTVSSSYTTWRSSEAM
jgi:lipopolysaccharide/colanic/teichoic acid biosynthesis glycosyltransferase